MDTLVAHKHRTVKFRAVRVGHLKIVDEHTAMEWKVRQISSDVVECSDA